MSVLVRVLVLVLGARCGAALNLSHYVNQCVNQSSDVAVSGGLGLFFDSTITNLDVLNK